VIIGGLEKLTLIDFPGKMAAIIFTQNCNFRCQFCYNPSLVVCSEEKQESDNSCKTKGHSQNQVKNENSLSSPENDLFHFLESRRGKLDGVVITGGEPTLHSDLPEFIKKIRKMGYAIKLDTNGTNPKMLKELLAEKLLDYIAMDLKAPLTEYEKVVGVKIDISKIKESIKIIINSGVPYEFRTTVVPGLIVLDDIKVMGEAIKGAGKWYLQKFKSDTDLVNSTYRGKSAFADKEMTEMAKIGQKYVNLCEWR
jgi:pyruvate formate lyase activating enzyme